MIDWDPVMKHGTHADPDTGEPLFKDTGDPERDARNIFLAMKHAESSSNGRVFIPQE